MAGGSKAGFLADVLAEHAELAGLMIRMRETLLDAVDIDLTGLVRFDDRIDVHLDGLRAAGAEGYAAAAEALRAGKDGSLFVVAVLAVEQRNDEHASQLAAVAEATPAGQRELAAALAWVPPRRIEPWAAAFAARGEADRAAALLASHVHRLRPPADLARWMAADTSAPRRALAYQTLADAEGEVDVAVIEPGTRDPRPEVRLAALWALARKAPAAPPTEAFVSVAAERGDLVERSFDLAARCAPATAERLLSLVPPGPAGERAGIRAVVAAGIPSMVPWLWPRLRAPETARLAGWAYATLTGCDLRAEGLLRAGPAPPGVGPNDDPADPRVDLPPEHRAPWPDADRIEAHWERWRAGAPGARVLLGQAMTRELLRGVLARGTQPARAHASLELALQDRRTAVFCTRAPGFRQSARLGG